MNSNEENLLALKAELSQRIEKIDKDLHSRVANKKSSEQAVERQNDGVLLNLKNEAEFELEQIDRALLKLKNDEYGICEQCHNPIRPERLEAIPYASLCSDCAT